MRVSWRYLFTIALENSRKFPAFEYHTEFVCPIHLNWPQLYLRHVSLPFPEVVSGPCDDRREHLLLAGHVQLWRRDQLLHLGEGAERTL